MGRLTKPHIVIAGGGTGGHLFPGIAVVEVLQEWDKNLRFSFVGSPRGIEARKIPELGYDLHTVDVKPLKSGGISGLAKGMGALPVAGAQTLKLIGKLRPNLVVSVGGYAAGPFTLAASMKPGVKTALMEQNAVPGMTNKILSKFVDRCFVSFDETVDELGRSKCIVAGNPVRAQIRELVDGFQYVAPKSANMRILILGGSGGARSLNLGIPEALKLLPIEKQQRLVITHQCGRDRSAGAQGAYEGFHGTVDIVDFIDDMGAAYASCDFMICRAGMSTIAETTALGIPAIYVPLGSGDGHQVPNAKIVAEVGAGWMVRDADVGTEVLTTYVDAIMESPDDLEVVSYECRLLGRPEAADVIAQGCLELLS